MAWHACSWHGPIVPERSLLCFFAYHVVQAIAKARTALMRWHERNIIIADQASHQRVPFLS
eukprot:15435843-Alexandrium_andersonii.AAC.1